MSEVGPGNTFVIDESVATVFRNRVQQVFLYITDRCGLRCQQCLYKTTLANREFSYERAARLLRVFAKFGATKLTFIGGEPTLYDFSNQNEDLLRLIADAKTSGYEYVRIDTNGQQPMQHFFGDLRFNDGISNLAFSLDGPNQELNDGVRGKGTFHKAVEAIRLSVDSGTYTSITTCVHRDLVGRLDEMVDFASRIGAAELNFHPLFKMGIARDEFSGDTDIEPSTWMKVYSHLQSLPDVPGLSIRAPQRFVSQQDYALDPDAYGFCPVRMGERVLLHPNGDVRICALCIGTPLRVARIHGNRMVPEDSFHELSPFRSKKKPCMSQIRDFGDLVPLCISYKPGQKEHVWSKNDFDSRFSPRFLPIAGMGPA